MVLSSLRDFGITPGRFVAFFSLSLGSSVLEGFGLAMILPVLQFLEKGRDLSLLTGSSVMWRRIASAFGAMGWQVTLGSLLSAVLVLMLLRIGFTYCRQYYIAWFSQEMLHVTRMNLIHAWLGARYDLFSKLSAGQMVNLVTNETQRAGGGLASLLTLSANLVAIMGLIIVLLWVSVKLTLFAVLFLCVAGGLVWVFVRHSKKTGFSASDALKNFSFQLMERIMAIRLIKLIASEVLESGRMRAASAGVRDHFVRLRTYGARVDLIIEPIVVAGGLSILFVAVNFLGSTLAEVGLFMLILLRLLPMSQGLLREWQSLMACQGALSAVRQGLEQARSLHEIAGGNRPFHGLSECIRLEGVVFSYPGEDRTALEGVSLEIPAGRMTALVGPSGAGKSTLVDLLPLLRRPRAGKVLFDGVPAGEYDLTSLRLGIAFVSQEAIIFNDTVRANLAYVRQEASDTEIWEALERASAREFVESTKEGLATVLGERGASLSGGQRQRIALARALLQGAPVIVLDEPTSSLDSESELAIQKSINHLRNKGNVTIVVIAHRLSTIRRSDKIVVLDHGRVVQEGTHEELVLSEDWYAKVAAIQSNMEATGT